LATRLTQQLDRVPVVDVTELALVDRVAAQLLKPTRKPNGGLTGNAELQVFLLAHPSQQ